MTRHERFESDARKARENLRKHGVSFDDGEETLADPFFEMFHVEEYDDASSEKAQEELGLPPARIRVTGVRYIELFGRRGLMNREALRA